MPPATAIKKEEPAISEDEFARQVEELGALVDDAYARGARKGDKIDWMLGEDVVHQFNDDVILRVAYDKGCLITECCLCKGDDKKYLANGKYVVPQSEDLRRDLRSTKGISSGQCPECDREFRIKWGLPVHNSEEAYTSEQ